MYAVELMTAVFERWVGYCEKKNLASIGIDLNNPENFTVNAGEENYTIFAKVYQAMTGINVQGQPWCDTFVDTMFIHVFGVDMAYTLLGGFSAYTPTSANYFKQMGRYHNGLPQEGDIVFYRNSERINHTGYVVSFDGTTLITIEGNTSTENAVVANGGCVAKKTWQWNSVRKRIDGFGRPDYLWAIAPGWKKAADNARWWYLKTDGNYARDTFAEWDRKRYYFDKNGYMVTGVASINGKQHSFIETAGINQGAEWSIVETISTDFREV